MFSLGARTARRLQTTSRQDVRDCLIQRIDRRRLNSVVRPDVYSLTERHVPLEHVTQNFLCSIRFSLLHTCSQIHSLFNAILWIFFDSFFIRDTVI